MNRTLTSPSGEYNTIIADMIAQPHLLIAGATGSGKSVLINTILSTMLLDHPCDNSFVLIDPKRVELFQYRRLYHCAGYASEPRQIVYLLQWCIALMEKRYKAMRRHGMKSTNETPLYIVVDEFADLMTTQKKETLPLLCRLAQLGRAANIHLILATQRPTRDIVNGQIKVNMDSKVALRCPSAQDSRNIIGVSGAELLPRYGQALYQTPETMQPKLIAIKPVSDDEQKRRIDWWLKQGKRIV